MSGFRFGCSSRRGAIVRRDMLEESGVRIRRTVWFVAIMFFRCSMRCSISTHGKVAGSLIFGIKNQGSRDLRLGNVRDGEGISGQEPSLFEEHDELKRRRRKSQARMLQRESSLPYLQHRPVPTSFHSLRRGRGLTMASKERESQGGEVSSAMIGRQW